MDAVTHVPAPINETVLDYAPGSPERAALEVALVELAGPKHDLPHTIGGVRVEDAPGLRAAGAAGLAVVSGICADPDPAAAAARYLRAFTAVPAGEVAP